jgi:hypothetical protein
VSDQPANEPVHTGWLRTQLSGDIDTARSYLRTARKMVGALRTVHGVNERIGAGEPGGFYKQHLEMTDGTRIEVYTNNGLDTIRISTPLKPHSTSSSSSGEDSGGSTSSHSEQAGFSAVSEDEPLVAPRGFGGLETEPKKEDEEKQGGPYMWVGIRSSSADVPWYAVNAIMIEPRQFGTQAPPQGIVTTANYWEYGYIVLDWANPAAPLPFVSDSGARLTFNQAIEHHFEHYAHASPPTSVLPDQHGIVIYDDTNGGFFMCSKNGLMVFAVTNYHDGRGFAPSDDIDRWMPFDPELPSDQQNLVDGVAREFGDRNLGSLVIPERAWDVVYMLDPSIQLQDEPSDPRQHMSVVVTALQNECGMALGEAMVLPGTYQLAVHMLDTLPSLVSDRAGEVIALLADLGDYRRSALSDYDGHMNYTSGTFNTEIEIEVRLGKEDEQVTFRFATSIEACSNETYTTAPFGYGTPDPCFGNGPNPIGKNFAQQLLAIDVWGGSAGWVAPDVAPILGGGQFVDPGDARAPFSIYVYGDYGLAQVAEEDYPRVAGQAVFYALELASSGYFGDVFIKEWTVSQVTAAAAACHKGLIWLFNPMDCSFTGVPVINNEADYPPDGTSYPYFFWFYPYKLLRRDNCERTAALLLGPSGWEIETGQHSLPGEPPMTADCC